MTIDEQARRRRNMVDGQIKPAGVGDERLLNAFLEVPREDLVPPSWRDHAYLDVGSAIGSGPSSLSPADLARSLNAAAIGPDDTVLVLGDGSGCAAAVVARLARRVFAVEPEGRTNERLRVVAERLGVENLVPAEGSVERGDPVDAPFDVIVVEGGVPEVPTVLFDQLARGGRLVAIVIDATKIGRARLYIKEGERISQRVLFDVTTWAPIGISPANRFSF